MPRKRPASCNASGKEPKRQKNVMMLNEKVALLDVLRGESYAAVTRQYNLNESDV